MAAACEKNHFTSQSDLMIEVLIDNNLLPHFILFIIIATIVYQHQIYFLYKYTTINYKYTTIN